MERDECLAEMKKQRAIYESLKPKAFDIDKWQDGENGERQRIDALSIADLDAEWAASEAQEDAEKMRKRTVEMLRARRDAVRMNAMFNAQGCEKRAKTELLTAELIASLRDNAAEIEKRKTLGVVEVTFSQTTGGESVRVPKFRTPADDLAVTRAEQARARLLALALTPGDIRSAIEQIEDELHAADKAARWTPPAKIEQPAPVAAPRGFTTKSFTSDLEPVLE